MGGGAVSTVVFQSYRRENVPPWMTRCLDSVRRWAVARGWDYRFVGDAIFELVPGWYMEKAAGTLPIATDLGRLELARRFITEGYRRTVWLDADVLVFDPDGLHMETDSGFAFGRETWVGRTDGGRLKVFRNVHNAVCVFDVGNPFLDFYIHACLSIVGRHAGGMVPQIVGTKFLTALHNMVGFPLIDAVAMFSPDVVADIARGGGPALDLYRRTVTAPACAANLCSSLAETTGEDVLDAVCDILLDDHGAILNGRTA